LSWGDLDGDAFLDLAVGNVSSWEGAPIPNRVYRNTGIAESR